MAKVFMCQMTKQVIVNIKADSAEQAQEWLDTHNEYDIQAETKRYEVEYNNRVIGELDEDSVIDISEEEQPC